MKQDKKLVEHDEKRVLCLGDVHGGYKSLMQCLEKSKFDYKNDILICLGDIVDGWPETSLCIEEMLKIKNLIYVMGNHDVWVDNWFNLGARPSIWTTQGGDATIESYEKHHQLLIKHRNFFSQSLDYFKTSDNKLFVHGGCDPNNPLNIQDVDYLRWDRDLFNNARWNQTIHKEYNEIYLGHTTTWSFSHYPIQKGNVWLMDQGGGYEGKLSIIDIKTKEFWQSECVNQLYPDHHGRN